MLQPGTKAPEFEIMDQNGKRIHLVDFVGKNNVVLFFYPQADTAGCTIEACAFRDSLSEFEKTDAVIIGISPDQHSEIIEFSQKRKLGYFLASDPDWIVHQKYEAMPLFGFIRARATYVIDKKGIIRFSFRSRFRFASHSKKTLSFLRRIKFP